MLKEHNADYLGVDVLQKHGKQGIVMSNVAPEFARAETEAILQLCEKEKQYFTEHKDLVAHSSGLEENLMKCVIDSKKWVKWIPKETDIDSIIQDDKFRYKAILVCGHYFYMNEEIRKKRKILYNNLIHYGIESNPEAYVRKNIGKSIARYITSFQMEGLNKRVADYHMRLERGEKFD